MNNINKAGLIKYVTPIQYLENVSREYKCNVYVKRDDLLGVGIGGNKVRKLDYLLGEAKRRDCRLVVTSGSLQTNHGMLTALCASRLGMNSLLFLLVEESIKQKKLSGNLVLDDYIGCNVEFVYIADIMEDSSLTVEEKDHLCDERLEKKIEQCLPEYKKKYGVSEEQIYRITSAGSTPLGTLGYVHCMKEIAEQSKVKYDYIFCGNGSGGTYVGMCLGTELYMPLAKVIGVNIEEMNPKKPDFIVELIRGAAELLGKSTDIGKEQLRFLSHSVNEGYAIPDDETIHIIEYIARKEAFFLDPVYTAKIFNGALKEIKLMDLPQDSNVLILHSGGIPGIYNENMVAYREEKSKIVTRWENDSN